MQLSPTSLAGIPSCRIFADRDFTTVRAFSANELPLTVLIDAEGREIARATGGQKWDDPDSVAYLKAVSAPDPAS